MEESASLESPQNDGEDDGEEPSEDGEGRLGCCGSNLGYLGTNHIL